METFITIALSVGYSLSLTCLPWTNDVAMVFMLILGSTGIGALVSLVGEYCRKG